MKLFFGLISTFLLMNIIGCSGSAAKVETFIDVQRAGKAINLSLEIKRIGEGDYFVRENLSETLMLVSDSHVVNEYHQLILPRRESKSIPLNFDTKGLTNINVGMSFRQLESGEIEILFNELGYIRLKELEDVRIWIVLFQADYPFYSLQDGVFSNAMVLDVNTLKGFLK